MKKLFAFAAIALVLALSISVLYAKVYKVSGSTISATGTTYKYAPAGQLFKSLQLVPSVGAGHQASPGVVVVSTCLDKGSPTWFTYATYAESSIAAGVSDTLAAVITLPPCAGVRLNCTRIEADSIRFIPYFTLSD